MNRTVKWITFLGMMVIFNCLTICGAQLISPQKSAKNLQLREIAEQMQKTFLTLSGYSCIGYKRIYKNGIYLPWEKIYVEVTIHPRKIYLRWIGKVKRGQEVIWPAGSEDNRLIARGGGWKRMFKKRLKPTSREAMKDTLHPVTEIGFKYIIKLMFQQLQLAEKHNINLVWHECRTEEEQYCIEVEFPKEQYPEFYCQRVRLCLYDNFLPRRIQVWQKAEGKKELILVEDYSYTELKLKFKDGKKEIEIPKRQ